MLKLIPKRTGQRRYAVFALFIFALIANYAHAASTGTPSGTPKDAPIHEDTSNDNAPGGMHGLGLGIGQTLLMADFSKNVSDALGYQLMYSYEASPMLGLLAMLSISEHSNSAGTNTLNIKGLSPNLKVNLAYIDKLIVYMVAGLGFFVVDEKVGTLQGTITTLGFDLGGGFSLALSKHVQFGTQILFNSIFNQTTSTDNPPNPSGMTIGGTYVGLYLNVMYLF